MAGAGLSRGADILSFLSGLLTGGGGTAVGLSIGSSSIKLVELKKAGKSWKLLHFGIVQLPENVIVNREIVNQIAVVESIKTLVGQIRLNSKAVCTALSGTALIIKRMSVEAPNPRELQDQVFWEAEQYLPFDVSEVVMDFHTISKTRDGKTDVILVAVKRGVLDSYMSSVEDAGLSPKVVDSDFFALQNVFEANYPVNPSEAVALIDIGAAASKMVVVHTGVPVFTKDTALGGRNLTSEIQRNLNLTYADAETLKMGGSGPLPQEVSDLMQIAADNFATEIKRSLDFYSASSSGAPVSSILLGGGSARIPNLSRTVEDVTGLPTQIINPFNAISYDPAVFTQDYLNAIAPLAAVPIGLALRLGAR
ncbi:MAG: pilus assembly protein PilM [Oligoflexia bacterium]|nr:pilus assembly protein PilM [Oligoflexia bacterium]